MSEFSLSLCLRGFGSQKTKTSFFDGESWGMSRDMEYFLLVERGLRALLGVLEVERDRALTGLIEEVELPLLPR